MLLSAKPSLVAINNTCDGETVHHMELFGGFSSVFTNTVGQTKDPDQARLYHPLVICSDATCILSCVLANMFRRRA